MNWRISSLPCWLCCAVAVAQAAQPMDDSLRQAFERTIYSLKDLGHETWRGDNRTQRMTVEFDEGGARLRHPDGSIKVRLGGYGYGAHLVQPAPARLCATGSRLEYQRGELTEWYVNGAQGLEQGFTFQTRQSESSDGEPLTIALEVDGKLTLKQEEGGVSFLSGRVVVFRYAGLRAVDARGRTLPSRLEAHGREIRLVVEDRSAQYPLVVDPTWSQQAELTASDAASGANFGISAAVSGDTAVIGAYNATVGSNLQQGAAYVFVRSGGSWSQQAELTSSDGLAHDNFGISVSVDGGTAVVGAYAHGVNGNQHQGAAYVFVQSGTSWSQQSELTAFDGVGGNKFGNSVSVSGNTALIASSAHKVGTNSGQGTVYVFSYNNASWSQSAELTSSDGLASDNFGVSVSLYSGTAVIGASRHQVGSNTSQGAAYVFSCNNASWSQSAELTASDGLASDGFGNSVSVSGGTAVVGARSHPVGSNGLQGAAYVFVQSGTSWSQQQELTASDGAANEAFGNSVSVSGVTAVIASYLHTVGSNTNQGAAYVFTQSGTSWSQQSELTAFDGVASDYFGWAVSVSGGTTVSGAIGHSSGMAGAAYVYVLPASLSISATHSSPAFQSGPETITLTVANDGAATAAAATVSDTIDSAFTINSVSPGCSVSDQTVSCTLAAGTSAASTAFSAYVTASSTAGASISNTATLTDNTDAVASGSSTDTIVVSSGAPQVDSSLSQVVLSGSTDNGPCANHNLTLTATDLLQNTSAGTLTNPYAVISTLSQGNTLLSQSADSASVVAGGPVTFTFHIQLATCNTFQLSFDVLSN